MSSAIVSPFASALLPTHQFFEVDDDGDAIMTDAVTGLPIYYGGRVRGRSDSFDEDDRPSKRSRSSSGDTLVASPFGALSPIRAPSSPVAAAASAPAAPRAPKKAPAPAPAVPPHNEDGDGAESAARNLAERMAEAVLEGEPRDGAAAPAVPPPAGEEEEHQQGWCSQVRCPDLALRLDMRHPRVVLNLLRFVKTYNELAPEGEEIHFPLLDGTAAAYILNHESVAYPAPEFAADVAELRALVSEFSCFCEGCDAEFEMSYLQDDDTSSSSPYSRDW
jgi:hypothetical protein